MPWGCQWAEIKGRALNGDQLWKEVWKEQNPNNTTHEEAHDRGKSGPGLPVNLSPTDKPASEASGGGSTIAASSMPSEDGCNYDSKGGPNCAVTSEGWQESVIDPYSAEYEGKFQTKDQLPNKEEFKTRVTNLVDQKCADYLNKFFTALPNTKGEVGLFSKAGKLETPPDGVEIGSKKHIEFLFDRVANAKNGGIMLVDKLREGTGAHASGRGDGRKIEILRLDAGTAKANRYFGYDILALQELVHHAAKDFYGDREIDAAALSLITDPKEQQRLKDKNKDSPGKIAHDKINENCFQGKPNPYATTTQ